MVKITRIDGREIKRVIAAMVTDRVVCSRIASRWSKEGLFDGVAENLIGRWCIDYLAKYGVVPGRQIQAIFEGWMGGKDEKTVELVGKVLSSISDEYERSDNNSPDYVLDIAGRVFNRIQLRRVIEAAESDLDANDEESAMSRLAELSRVELGVGSIIKPGEDWDAWDDAFDEDQTRPLIMYPGALGEFVGAELARDSFVAFEANAKRGKSWWLQDLGYRGVKARRRVAYFEAGDLSKRQVLRRLGQRALMRPRMTKVCCIPVDYPSKDEPPVCENRELVGVAPSECLAAWRRAQRGRDLFRLSCFSNRSLEVSRVASILSGWTRDGWEPDVLIIDYADILAVPRGVRETRDQINENWMAMRRISQDFHCLVVTATQADAASYDKNLLSRRNFSDDRRKHDHVTAMIGLNVTDEDKEQGRFRLNFLDRRDAAFTEGRQVHVAGCLEIRCPVMKSVF